jgi:hypothetical protein
MESEPSPNQTFTSQPQLSTHYWLKNIEKEPLEESALPATFSFIERL